MWSMPNRRRTIRARRMAHLAGSGYPMAEATAEELAEPPAEEKAAPRKTAAKKAAPKRSSADE